MERQLGGEICADYDGDIHHAKRIGSQFRLSLLQRPGDTPSGVAVAPPHKYPGALAQCVGIAHRHDVNTARSKQAGDIACQSGPAGPVQDFHLHAVANSRHRPRQCPRAHRFGCGALTRGAGPQHQGSHGNGGNQRSRAGEEARVFQKRTVGSSRGHPESTV